MVAGRHPLAARGLGVARSGAGGIRARCRGSRRRRSRGGCVTIQLAVFGPMPGQLEELAAQRPGRCWRCLRMQPGQRCGEVLGTLRREPVPDGVLAPACSGWRSTRSIACWCRRSEQRRAVGTRSGSAAPRPGVRPGRRRGGRGGPEPLLEGIGDELRGVRINGDVPAQQHSADDLAGRRERVLRRHGRPGRRWSAWSFMPDPFLPGGPPCPGPSPAARVRRGHPGLVVSRRAAGAAGRGGRFFRRRHRGVA